MRDRQPRWIEPLSHVRDEELRRALVDVFDRARREVRSRSDAGEEVVVVLVSRRLTCIYAMLTAAGMPRFDAVVSDRALAANADVGGRCVVLVDDAVVLGTTLVDTYDRLMEAGCAAVSTVVACIDAKRSNPSFLDHVGVTHDDDAVRVDASRVQRLAQDIATALFHSGTPYFTDFPVATVTGGRSPATSNRWHVADVTSPLFAGSGRRALSLVPAQATLDRIRARMDTEANSMLSLAKLRCYEQPPREPGGSPWTRIVPMGIPHPAVPDALDEVLVSLEDRLGQGKHRLRWRDWSAPARHRLLQMYLSTCVLIEGWNELTSEAEDRPTASSLDFAQAALYFGADADLMAELFDRTAETYLASEGSAVVTGPRRLRVLPRTDLGTEPQVRRRALESAALVEAARRRPAGIGRLHAAIPPAHPGEGDVLSVDPTFAHRVLSIFGSVDADLERSQQAEYRDLSYAGYEALRRDDRSVTGLWPRVLRMGLTLDDLAEAFPIDDPADPWTRSVLSLAVDIGNDLGVVVPTTVEQPGGLVFRQYRSGETAFLADVPHQDLIATTRAVDSYTAAIIAGLGVTEEEFRAWNAVLLVDGLLGGSLRQSWTGRVLDVEDLLFRASVVSDLEDGQSDVAILEVGLLPEPDRGRLEPGVTVRWQVVEVPASSGRRWRAASVSFLGSPRARLDPFGEFRDEAPSDIDRYASPPS